MFHGLLLQHGTDLVDDHCDSHLVLHPAWHDEIGNLSLWLDIGLEARFDIPKPLLDDTFYGSTSFAHVTDDLLASASAR